MSAARQQLTRLPEEFEQDDAPNAIAVTRHGEPVLAVLPWDFYESLVETLEVMGDPELMAALRASVEDIAEGRTTPWQSVKERLTL
jgi:PHD/YefM family antitoxin component YafN of YafNO toxin-antitoxin module